MPDSNQQRVDEIVRQKLEFVLSLAGGSFAGDIAKRITLGDVHLSGIQLEGSDDTVSMRLSRFRLTVHSPDEDSED